MLSVNSIYQQLGCAKLIVYACQWGPILREVKYTFENRSNKPQEVCGRCACIVIFIAIVRPPLVCVTIFSCKYNDRIR